jgi:transcriptional regulator with XRE-family HTH domain
MPIHIGELIKQKADAKKLSLEDLGKLINRTRQTVGDIYKRKSIDTELLIAISIALDFDFFEIYYSKDPLKRMREKHLLPFKNEIDHLTSQLSLKEQRIKDLERTLESDSKIINLLEEEVKKYTRKK